MKLNRKDSPRVYQDFRPLSRESLIRGERLAARQRAAMTIAISLWIIAIVALIRAVNS
jgi:hypothetical protein